MAGPTGRIVIDPEKFRRLIDDMQRVRDTAWESSRAVRTTLDGVGLSTARAAHLKAVGDWADEQVTMLRHRLMVAEATDRAYEDDRPTTAGRLTDHPPAPVSTPRGETPRGEPDFHVTPIEAYTAGAALAERFTALSSGAVRVDTGDLTVLGEHTDDRDFVEGFHDALGPANLAQIVYQVEGLTQPPETDPSATGASSAGPSPDHTAAAATLGASLAAYTCIRPVDEAWLGSFNTRGLGQTMESGLFVSLLPHGRFDPGLLQRLGDQYYATHGEVDDVGLFAGGHAPAVTRPKYEAALLRAIADSPGLAPRFAGAYLEEFVDQSHLRTRDILFRRMIPDEVEQARARLVAHAGGIAARRADPPAAGRFVTRAVALARARDIRRDGGWEVSPWMRAVLVRLTLVRPAQTHSGSTRLDNAPAAP